MAAIWNRADHYIFALWFLSSLLQSPAIAGDCYILVVFFKIDFGCVAASDSLFDSRGRFSGSSYPMNA